MSVLMHNDEMIAGVVPKGVIKYIDAELPSTTIDGNKAIYQTAPRHDKNYIGCMLLNNQNTNTFLVGQPIYRPNAMYKYTTTILNTNSSALAIEGYIRWYYIE